MFKKLKKAIKGKDKKSKNEAGGDEWEVEGSEAQQEATETGGEEVVEEDAGAKAETEEKPTKVSDDNDEDPMDKSVTTWSRNPSAGNLAELSKSETAATTSTSKPSSTAETAAVSKSETAATAAKPSSEALAEMSISETPAKPSSAALEDASNSSSTRRARSGSPKRSGKERSSSNDKGRGGIGSSSVRTSRSVSPVRARKNANSASVRSSARGSKKKTAVKAKKTISKKSKWEEGLEVIDELLLVDSGTYNAMTEEQRKALANVKNLLLNKNPSAAAGPASLSRQESAIQHVPRDLILEQKKEQRRRQKAIFPKNQPRFLNPKDSLVNLKRGSTYFILQEYAGVKTSDPLLSDEMPPKKEHMKRKPKGVGAPPPPELRARISDGAGISDLASYTPQEFRDLPKENQQRLCELLSWESLGKWGFDIFELNDLTKGQPLLFMGWAVIGSPYAQAAMKQASDKMDTDGDDEDDDGVKGYPFMDEFKIPAHKLCNYLRVIQQDYHDDNPYHNAIHAADVVQALHCFIQMSLKHSRKSDDYQAFLKSCPNLHLFAILLSAVIHDVDHPGKNNAFQTKLKTELAVVYNDVSVLENWHVACAFARMLDLSLLQANVHSSEVVHAKLNKEHKNAECNILGEASPQDFDAIRNLMIEAVLHTDMSKHFAMVDSVKGLIAIAAANNNSGSGSGGDAGAGAGIFWNALMFMLHMADISNQAKPGVLARQWTDRCMSEFFAQGDQEANLGVPISPNCDRNVTALPESQVGFIKFVVQPAYAALGDLIPFVKEEVLPIVQANLDHWVKEKEIEDGSVVLEEGDLSEEDMSVDG